MSTVFNLFFSKMYEITSILIKPIPFNFQNSLPYFIKTKGNFPSHPGKFPGMAYRGLTHQGCRIYFVLTYKYYYFPNVTF